MATKKTVTTKNVDGKEITLIVRTPTANDLQKAQMESNKVFKMALDSDSILRSELVEYLTKRGMWSEEMQKKLEETNNSIYEKEKVLMKGGIKRSEAKSICMSIRDLRYSQASLLVNQRQHDMYTAEAQADNAKFDYLVSSSVFDEEGNRFFRDLDDYKSRASEEAAVEAASALAEIVNSYDPDWEKKLPENEFLIKHGFTNEKLQFVDKDKNLVDSEGRKINEEGRFINDKGELINRDGELVDKDGMPIVEFQPLLDDEPEVKEVSEETAVNPTS